MSRSAIGMHSHEFAAGRPYAERPERDLALHDRVAEFLLARALKPTRDWLRDPTRALKTIVEHVERHERSLRLARDSDVATQARSMRAQLRRDGFAPELVGKCFALVREAAVRTIGQRHYDVQLMAGWALLQGKLVEMETGEGKTMPQRCPPARSPLPAIRCTSLRSTTILPSATPTKWARCIVSWV